MAATGIRSQELDRAQEALDRGDVGETLGIVKGRVQDSVRGLKLLGQAHAALGEYPAAREAFARAAQLEPLDEETWLSLGSVLERERYFDRALDSYTKGLAASPKSARLARAKALLLADLARLGDAAAALRRAIEVADLDVELWLRLGAVELAREHAEDAEAAYDAAIRRSREPIGIAFAGRGLARAQRARAASAEADAASRPGERPATAPAGLAEARADLERALALDRDDPAPAYNLGWLHEDLLADPVSAEREYRAALARRADYVPALLRLAGLVERRGDKPEALALYRRALEASTDPRLTRPLRDRVEENGEGAPASRPASQPTSDPSSKDPNAVPTDRGLF